MKTEKVPTCPSSAEFAKILGEQKSSITGGGIDILHFYPQSLIFIA